MSRRTLIVERRRNPPIFHETLHYAYINLGAEPRDGARAARQGRTPRTERDGLKKPGNDDPYSRDHFGVTANLKVDKILSERGEPAHSADRRNQSVNMDHPD